MSGEQVLVTGGSGFLGAHCIVALLQRGYRVRTTVRSPAREQEVRDMVRIGGADPDGLEFAHAELGADAGWQDAVSGCAYVLHVASPFPPAKPDHEDDLIVPAREGTLRVLKAARGGGVRRVVVTSSFAAVGYRPTPDGRPLDERDWTDLSDPALRAYPKSKTLAERAAWDFVEREGGGLELAVVNPTAIFGPALGPKLSTSMRIIRSLLEGTADAGHRLTFGAVDVRDVAELHVVAMTRPEAAGQRYLAVSGRFVSPNDIAAMLRAGMGEAARLVPEPPFVEVPEAAYRAVSNEQARRLLGRALRSNEEAIVAAGESLVRLGLVPGPA